MRPFIQSQYLYIYTRHIVSNKASENEEVLNKCIEMLTSVQLQIRLHRCFQLETYYRENFQAVPSIFEIQDLAIGCIV